MKKTGGWKYLILAMLAFAGLGMEVILAFFLEPLIYQAPMQSWTDLQNISHWVITCAVWGLLSWGIVRFARKRYGDDLFERKDSPAAWRWAFEGWLHNRHIPWGGMLAAVTWGIAHFFTKGSSTGIGIMISALAYGCVYLLVNRDIRRAYPIIWLMFVL